MQWMRKLGSVAVIGALTLWASGASALSLVVDGPVAASNPSDIKFTISFDAQTTISGYEMFFTWDMSELTFVQATNLYSDAVFPFPFTVLDTTLGSGMVGIGRASVLQLSGFPTTGLLELVFTPTGTGDSPGSPVPGASLVLSLSAAGLTGGFSPASIVVSNPDPFFSFAAVPEPTTMALLLVGVGGLAWQGRRRSSY